MWNDTSDRRPMHVDPTTKRWVIEPSESSLRLLDADEVFVWVWTVGEYMRKYEYQNDGDWLMRRWGAVTIADDIILDYRRRVAAGGPGAREFRERLLGAGGRCSQCGSKGCEDAA